MPTAAEVLAAIAPELATVDETTRNLFLTLADNRTSGGYTADIRPWAVGYLAAHLLTKRGWSGAPGKTVISESVADLSRSYATTGSTDDLDGTSYGAELRRLQAETFFGPRTRMEGSAW